ncbi:hypothetical protein NA56DRAFT_744085 [Hyaloscypha hepaticicola]|uniref:BTB domain-containing protein n=1 Tax=Hyaloscypha hepaticicola TaxID=2082293 RepID=A0A2J6QKG8_9HELO|nr:hypothetical protein NA56DRAFT_744085 [Hyaloscypha hepaticicola]
MSPLTNTKTAKVKSTKRRSSIVVLAKVTDNVTSQPVEPQPAISSTLTPLDPLDPEYDEFVQVSKPDMDRRPFKKARLDTSTETITMLVGEEEIRFLLHEKILCESSPFFELVCKSELMNDHVRMIKLHEDDPELVDIMVYWMYRKYLCLPVYYFNTDPVSMTSSLNTPPGLLARLYTLAEKYQIHRLQNDIIDALILWLDDFNLSLRVPASVIQYVWSNTFSEDCKLRQFLLEYVKAEYTFHDLRSIGVKEEVKEKDFWYGLARGFALTLDCMRDAVEGMEGELVEQMLASDLRSDVCMRWHKHKHEKERQCDGLKGYVLDEEEERVG